MLIAESPSAPLGVPIRMRMTAFAASSGLGLVYFGAQGFDASGCGTVIPGLGELLIAAAPAPYLIGAATLSVGVSDLTFTVPTNSAYVGLTVHLQGVAVDPALAHLVELSNALEAKLGP